MDYKDLCEGFADRYDLEPSKLDEHDPLMVEFFRQIFSENAVQSVLDCASGTGRQLLLFHDLGCKVWGSDVTKAMLAQARKNLARFEIRLPFKQADYRFSPYAKSSSNHLITVAPK